MQNCFEPVINEKQKQIDAFVEGALNSLEERIERISVGTSDEYMAKLEEEEYAKAISILTDVYAECPVMQCIKDALNKPDYIWDSTFIESIGKEYVYKWYHTTLNGSIKDFKHDNTIYDEDNPYLSYIYKVVLYEKYALFLLGRIEQRKKLRSIDEDLRKQKEKAQMEVEVDAFIADMEQKLAERKAALDKDDTKEYTFGHNLKDVEIEVLTECVNEVNMFRTKDIVTKEQLKSILDCNPETILKARSNRLVAHFFDQLSIHHFITNEWQAVVAKNQLILASRKNDYINQNDLSVAVNYLRTNFLEEEYTTIEEYIKELKTLREKEKTEKKGK